MLNRLQNKIIGLLLLFAAPVFSQSPDNMYLEGSAFLAKGDYGKAVESLSMAITRDNADEQLFIRRGSALLNMNEAERAILDFNEANEINPQVADLWLAKAYASLGDASKAVSFLKSHLESPFKQGEESIRKDPAFNSIQDSPEWEGLWQKDWYTQGEKAIADADFYIRKKQYDQAIDILDREVGRDPANQKLLMARGKAFMRQGNYAAAAGDFSSVITHDKTYIDAYAERGSAYLGSEKYREAAADFTRALKNDPANFNLYLMRAKAYAGHSEWNAAIKDMQVYMKYFDDDLDAVYQCGEYYFAAGDYISALKSFNRNLLEDPNNAVFLKARGKTYFQTNTNRYAISDLSMSLDLNPNDSETWMYHGLAAIKSGDAKNGCSSLRRAESMGNAEAVRYVLENCKN